MRYLQILANIRLFTGIISSRIPEYFGQRPQSLREEKEKKSDLSNHASYPYNWEHICNERANRNFQWCSIKSICFDANWSKNMKGVFLRRKIVLVVNLNKFLSTLSWALLSIMMFILPLWGASRQTRWEFNVSKLCIVSEVTKKTKEIPQTMINNNPNKQRFFLFIKNSDKTQITPKAINPALLKNK